MFKTHKAISLFLFLSFLSQLSYSQTRSCSFLRYESRNATNKLKEINFENWLQGKIALEKIGNSIKEYAKYEPKEIIIPVVFHIIHNGESYGRGTNIPDEQIYSQLRVLNEDFNRENRDRHNTPLIFQDRAANVGVRFVLAKQDPCGRPSSGINRVYSRKTSWNIGTRDRNEMSSLSYWPSLSYVNIWVMNLGNQFLGRASFPESTLQGLENEYEKEENLDGIYMNYKYLGSIDDNLFPSLQNSAPNNRGRTLTHEAGHYLGLLHTWGDGISTCNDGDYCNDTPRTTGPNQTQCNGFESNCPSEVEKVMIENYMDYTPDDCMNLFTKNQEFRMITVLNNSPRRKNLQYSKGLEEPSEEMQDYLSLVEITNPEIVTSLHTQDLTFKIQNISDSRLSSFDLEYSINGNHKTQSFHNLDIAPKEMVSLEVENQLFKLGLNDLILKVKNPNGILDCNPMNNRRLGSFIVNSNTLELPYKQVFKNIENNHWASFSPAGALKWQIIGEDQFQYPTLDFNKGTVSENSWFVSPSLNFENKTNVSSRIIYEYTNTTIGNDHLDIHLSNSFPENYENKLKSIKLEPSEKEQTILLDLNDFANESNVRIGLNGIKNSNGKLKIKRIDFYDHSTNDVIFSESENVVLYPNPSSENQIKLHFDLEKESEVTTLSLYNLSGIKLQEFKLYGILNQTRVLHFEKQLKGIYILKIINEDIQITKKIILH